MGKLFRKYTNKNIDELVSRAKNGMGTAIWHDLENFKKLNIEEIIKQTDFFHLFLLKNIKSSIK